MTVPGAHKIKRIEPAYFAGDLGKVINGTLNTYAVHIEYDHAGQQYLIGRVEQWNAYEHLNATQRGIFQVAEQDELGAHNKMRSFLDNLQREGLL